MKVSVSKLILGCLVLIPYTAVLSQRPLMPVVAPFDRYGRINWNAEKERLDRFGLQLKSLPDMIGYVYIREAQISCDGSAMGHAIEVTKYLIQAHQLPWNRVAWRDLGYGDGYEVSLWLFPSGHPPQYVPAYKSEAVYIEDCGSLVRRSRWFAKQRSLRRAANKPLQRTRR